LFNAPEDVNKYVEIGAKTTLATMVKRMADRQPAAEKLSKSIEILSYSDNKADLYYEYTPDAEILPQTSTTSEPAQPTMEPTGTSTSTPAAAPSQAPPPTPLAPANPAVTQIPSTPKGTTDNIPTISATHIVIALTAQKVKKPFDALPLQKSIQELSGGR
jgi:fatty acid synthase subunit alpha, fungi type